MCRLEVWNTSGMSTASSPAPANTSDVTATAFQNLSWRRRNQRPSSVGTRETMRNAPSMDIICPPAEIEAQLDQPLPRGGRSLSSAPFHRGQPHGLEPEVADR